VTTRHDAAAGPAAATTPAAGSRGAALDRLPAQSLVILGMLTTQLGAALARHLFEHHAPAGVGMLRLSVAALVLLAVARPRLKAFSRRDLLVVAMFGGTLAAMNLTFYEALNRLPLGVAVTVEFVGPLAVAVVGSTRKLDLLWAVLAAAGILSFWHGGGHTSTLGLLLALLAGAGWAGYIVLNSLAGRRFSDSSGLAVAMSIGALLSIPFGVMHATSSLFSLPVLASALVVGVASSALPYSLETNALRRMSTRVFGILMSLEPAVAALVGLIVLGQGLVAREWLGVVLVVIASVGVSRRPSRSPVETAAPHD
jgi:inner membrane transporter RhtA